MLWWTVCSVVLVLRVRLAEAARAESPISVAVKQEVEDIFRTVQRFMSQVDNPDSKTGEATVKEKVHTDYRHAGDQVDERPVALRAPPSPQLGLHPGSVPIGIVMTDNLYPLVVGKSVDTGRPFVTNLDRQHALVVARAAPGGDDYKLLIPFPVMVGGEGVHGVHGVHGVPTPGYMSLPGQTSPRQLHPERPRGYRQHSGEEPDSGDIHPPPGKKYLKTSKNVKSRPEKVFHSPYLRSPDPAVHGYRNGYSKQGISYMTAPPKPNIPRKNIPIAYRQPRPQHSTVNYSPPRQPTHPPKPMLYPPVNYAGAYASVPKDFRPSPYLGNISDDPEPDDSGRGRGRGRGSSRPQYDDFTEQDYIDSINSPDAGSGVGGVHHVTHHVDDYLGKIYEEMYYKMPPPPPPSPHYSSTDIDRKGKQETPPARHDVKLFNNSNKTDTSRLKGVIHPEISHMPIGSDKSR